MPSCNSRTIWIFVLVIVMTNSLLLIKYYTMLQDVEKKNKHPLIQKIGGGDHNGEKKNTNNDHVLQKPPQLQGQQENQQQQQPVTPDAQQENQQQQKQSEYKYEGPYDKKTYRFNYPEISKDSKSPWGRLLHALSVDETFFSTLQQNNNEDNIDIADLIVSKIIPLRFWRLDPLVESAVHQTKEQIHAKDGKFRSMLHKVKHQASVMKFRWPWHMNSMFEKNEASWIESKAERENSLKKVQQEMMISSSSSSSVSTNNNKLTELNPDEIDFSDRVAKMIEDELLNNDKLPVFSRKNLASRLRARKIYRNTGCNILRVPFTNPTEDEKCISYLSNIQNWKSLRALPVRYDARTIKFQIEFNEPDLHSVLKVPQRLFPFEAFAEIGAYHADRVLGVRRIPPTAYACIPKHLIREMMKRDGDRVECDEDTLKESGVKSYNEMVEKEILKFSEKSSYNVDDHGDCVGVSVQPLMADVHHLLDSALVVPYKTHDKSWHGYFNFTLSNNHNNKHNHQSSSNFGPFGETIKQADLPIRFLRTPYVGTVLHMAEVVAFDFIVGNNDRSPNKNFFVVGSCIDDASVCQEDETSFFDVKENNKLVGVDGDVNGKNKNNNNMKRESKNNNNKAQPILSTKEAHHGQEDALEKREAIAAASVSTSTTTEAPPQQPLITEEEKKSIEQLSKVDWIHDKSALRRPGPPSFIHIDQGMAFYQTPTDNVITKSLKAKEKTGFCIFRRRFVNRLLDLFGVEPETLDNGEKESMHKMIQRAAIDPDVKLSSGGFVKLMQSSVPSKALHSAVLTKNTFTHCERRMRKVLLQLSRCLAEYPIEDVIAP